MRSADDDAGDRIDLVEGDPPGGLGRVAGCGLGAVAPRHEDDEGDDHQGRDEKDAGQQDGVGGGHGAAPTRGAQEEPDTDAEDDPDEAERRGAPPEDLARPVGGHPRHERVPIATRGGFPRSVHGVTLVVNVYEQNGFGSRGGYS